MTLSALLLCTDLNETREFYESKLGFSATDSAEGTLTVEKDGAKLIFTEQNLWGGDSAFTGTLYITVQDVDGYYASIQEVIQPAWEPQDMPYGSREFGIRDCNGYLLAFQQEI